MKLLEILAGAGEKLIDSVLQGGVQRAQWRREDNAVQRRVADLKAAGLSPVLAAGSAASSSPPIFASKAAESASSAATNALQLMMMKKEIQKSDAEINLVNETSREKKIMNDASSKQFSYSEWNPETQSWDIRKDVSTVAERRAQLEVEKVGWETATANFKAIADRYGLSQAEYDSVKYQIKKNSPGLSEAELELKALSLSITLMRQQAESQGMNLELYRRTGVAPQLFGAAMGLAGSVVPHGLYKLP